MEDLVWQGRMLLTLINLLLLLMLINLNLVEYKKLNSPITLGFLLFVFALFFRTLFSAPLIHLIFIGTRVSSIVDPYRIIGDAAELIALVMLLYLSTRE
jgi:hypothetical protein